jgi:16S rRNA (adenine1518-N6/adenine1519-N6)-dimethyltransferase
MPLYRPSELSAFLSSIGAAPKRTLSQNFLIDGNVLAKIVAAVMPSPSMCIIEIGSGPGVLTEAFLEQGASVIAIEKDRLFAQSLGRLDAGKSLLTVVEGDALDCCLHDLVADRPAREIIVVSNMPYHLTTPLLNKLIEERVFSKAVVMMQEEAARRFLGESSCLLGLMASFYYRVSYLFRVPRGCFFPQPKVDSAVIALERIPPPLEYDEKFLFSLMQEAFAHPRKSVMHSLRKHYGEHDLVMAFDRSHLSQGLRPAHLSLAQWVCLFENLPKASLR